MTPDTSSLSRSSCLDFETGSSNHQYRPRNGRLLPSQRPVPVVLSAPPANLRWFSLPLLSSKCCAVCGQRPPPGTIAIPFGPQIVRKRKTPLPLHFVLVKGKQQSSWGNGDGADGGGKNTVIYSCRECFDFFRSIVVRLRECTPVLPTELLQQLKCVDNSENCAIDKGEKVCPSCWLDRCLMAGLSAQAVTAESCFNWTRLKELDAAFQRRLDMLRSLQNTKAVSTFKIVDEKVLAFSLLKAMSYSDQQFTTLRLACSAQGRISRVFRMFEHCTIAELTGGAGPMLMGSAYNQKRLLFDIDFSLQSHESCNSCDRFDCIFPNSSKSEAEEESQSPGGKEYVTVWLEHSDSFFRFFTLIDVFMCFELAHTMPIFRLLDVKDTVHQLAFTALHCRTLTQTCFSVSLNAPELIHPGGYLSHRTMMAVLRKAWDLMLKQENEEEFEQENAIGTRNDTEVELIPVKVLKAPELLIELERCSREQRVELLKPFFHARVTATEVFLLRALIMTSPNSPGLSETARLLLGIEWNKYSKLLRSFLLAELGSPEAASKRHTVLMGLLDTVTEMRALSHRIGQLSKQVFQVPDHRKHLKNSITSDTNGKCRSLPAFMKECRHTYDANAMLPRHDLR